MIMELTLVGGSKKGFVPCNIETVEMEPDLSGTKVTMSSGQVYHVIHSYDEMLNWTAAWNSQQYAGQILRPSR